jgi:hypothetical protein
MTTTKCVNCGAEITYQTNGFHAWIMRSRGKTEHAGPKRGRGAFYGKRQDAKKFSNRHRRINGKVEVKEQRNG